jgi:hypothetical protein
VQPKLNGGTQYQRIPEREAVQPMKINGTEDVSGAGSRNAKLSESSTFRLATFSQMKKHTASGRYR